MSAPVRWFIRTAAAWLGVGLVLGVWMAVDPVRLPLLRAPHLHALLAGFVSLMIFGVLLGLVLTAIGIAMGRGGSDAARVGPSSGYLFVVRMWNPATERLWPVPAANALGRMELGRLDSESTANAGRIEGGSYDRILVGPTDVPGVRDAFVVCASWATTAPQLGAGIGEGGHHPPLGDVGLDRVDDHGEAGRLEDRQGPVGPEPRHVGHRPPLRAEAQGELHGRLARSELTGERALPEDPSGRHLRMTDGVDPPHLEAAVTEIDTTIAELRERGHVYEREGATWLRTTSFGDDKDRVLIRAGGEPTYFAADVAYHRDKLARGFDRHRREPVELSAARELVLVEEVAGAALMAEEEPVAPRRTRRFALLQERSERRDAGPRSHHDDRHLRICGKCKRVSALDIGFDLHPGLDAIGKKCGGDTQPSTCTDRIAQRVDRQRDTGRIDMRRRRDRIESRLQRFERFKEGLGIGTKAWELFQRGEHVQRCGVSLGIFAGRERLRLEPTTEPGMGNVASAGDLGCLSGCTVIKPSRRTLDNAAIILQ